MGFGTKCLNVSHVDDKCSKFVSYYCILSDRKCLKASKLANAVRATKPSN